jgi:hypothetical protein
VELARGIEPPTCGLQISFRGIAEVLDKSGNPLVYTVLSLSPLCFFLLLSASIQPVLSRPLTLY